MILKASRRLRKFFNVELTNESIWREIIEEGRLDNIYQLTRLDVNAAYHLVKHEKRKHLLTLGITEMQPDVAAELAKYHGDKLYLNSVRNLATDAARAIARFKGVKLTLNGLKTVTLPMLGRLSSYKGILHLDGVEEIDISEADSARAETVFKLLGFVRLSMASLKKPSIRLLRALSRYPGSLDLNGIEALTETEAEILAEHPGSAMVLQGIKIPTLSLKRLLTCNKGVLDLSCMSTITGELLKIAALRPHGYTVFSTGVKQNIKDFQREIPEETTPRQRVQREPLADWEEQVGDVDSHRKEEELLEEFNRFDEMTLTVPRADTGTDEEEMDDYEIEVSDDVLETIEVDLNLKMNQKTRQVEALLSRGMSRLSSREKQELMRLQEEIRALKERIRAALDVLVEQRELGAIVFNGSDELAAYLNASAVEDDENDALAHIEEADLFSGCFESRDFAAGSR
jgi:hypothetical protein